MHWTKMNWKKKWKIGRLAFLFWETCIITDCVGIRRFSSVQFISVAQLCLTLWDSTDCSMPGFPIHHQLPELAQTHVHRVGDAIQPSHPLSSPSPAFNLSRIRVFSSESALHIRRPKHWSTRTWMQFINVLTRSPRTPALTTRPQISGSPRTLQPH